MTIIISTHDVDLVPVYADKVYVMYDGKILKEGTPKEVFSDVETIRKANLRLPRVAHLIEILNKRIIFQLNGDLQLERLGGIL